MGDSIQKKSANKNEIVSNNKSARGEFGTAFGNDCNWELFLDKKYRTEGGDFWDLETGYWTGTGVNWEIKMGKWTWGGLPSGQKRENGYSLELGGNFGN